MSSHSEGPIRWNLSRAADEFGAHRETIRKALTAGGHSPDEAGTFTTRQIHQALSGDREEHKARLAKEQADRIALDNAERKKELIPVADAAILNGRVAFAIRQRIATLPNLTTEEKNEILADVRRLAEVDFTKAPDDDETDASA